MRIRKTLATFALLTSSTSFAALDPHLATPVTGGMPVDSTSIIPTGTGDLSQPPAPLKNCSATYGTWSAGGNACSGVVPSAYNGTYAQAINSADGFIGGANYLCKDGTFYGPQDASCTQSSSGGVQPGQLSTQIFMEDDNSPATFEVPSSQKIKVRVYNGVSPNWGGDIQSARGAQKWVSYERHAMVYNQYEDLIKDVLIDNRVVQYSILGGKDCGNYDCKRGITNYYLLYGYQMANSDPSPMSDGYTATKTFSVPAYAHIALQTRFTLCDSPTCSGGQYGAQGGARIDTTDDRYGVDFQVRNPGWFVWYEVETAP